MSTKLKIDLNQGILEIEGSESFVKIIYNDFKTHFAGIEVEEDDLTPPRRSRNRRLSAAKITEPGSAGVSKPASVNQGQEKPEPAPPLPVYTLVEGLELGAADDRLSLVEFMDAKFPLTNEERNIVFLYYLQHNLKLKMITTDHIYTCYRHAKIRVPLNLENSLRITASQHKWLRMTQTGKMTLTATGKQYVEKQLPKKVKH